MKTMINNCTEDDSADDDERDEMIDYEPDRR